MINDKEIQSLRQGHRTRLREKFLADQLSDCEILELLLTYAIPRRDVHMLAKQLHNKYGNIHMILSAPVEELMKFDGIKENTATFFKLIHKITEMDFRVTFDNTPIFFNHNKLENYCKLLLANKQNEEFHVFYLDSLYRLIEDELHSTGTIDWSAVYTREIVKRALDLNAQYVVLLHNHPSNTPTFSKQDIEITTEVQKALAGLNITLYDHLLLSCGIIHSAKNMFLLNETKNE